MNEGNSGSKSHGWANFETWTVANWFYNVEPSHRRWTERARAWKGRGDATSGLAAEMKADVEGESPLDFGAGVIHDLLTTAIEAVEWGEIAEDFLGGVEPDAGREASPGGAEDEGVGPLEGLGRVRAMTRDVYLALAFDTWPTPAAATAFGIASEAHYAALQRAVRDDVTPEQLDRALGSGPALTALIGPDNPHHGVAFRTPRDVIMTGVDSCDGRDMPEPTPERRPEAQEQTPEPARLDAEGLFGEVIFADSRSQSIEDGVLVDVSETAEEAGFRIPVALSRAVWAEYVAVPEGVVAQDEPGRLWDVLWMCRHGIARGEARDASEVLFRLHVRNDNRDGEPPVVTLKAVCGPGDDGSPCITIMRTDED